MVTDSGDGFPVPCISSRMSKPESIRGLLPGRDGVPRSDLWTNGLICAFEYMRRHRRASDSVLGSRVPARTHTSIEYRVRQTLDNGENAGSPRAICRDKFLDTDDGVDGRIDRTEHCYGADKFDGSHWVAIGWERVSTLVRNLQEDASWSSVLTETLDEDELTVTEMATPYWERPAGPVWWCHLSAEHDFVKEWLGNAQWLHPAVSLALRDESKLISERMKHLLYEVPVRVAGGLLFELLGQSAGDPFVNEDDIPIVLRSWQAQHFLITVLHVKGPTTATNVLGIAEVQELLAAGGYNVPRTVHEVIAHLASRLCRWDDRLFRKAIFGAADEIELMFMNRRNYEDLNLVSLILNQEIRRLSKQAVFLLPMSWLAKPLVILMQQTVSAFVGPTRMVKLLETMPSGNVKGNERFVIRVKWSLHAREEIVFELLQHLRGDVTRALLEGINKSTRGMIDEQEAVRGRLFTIQDVMQSIVRAWLQDRSLKVTHNLAVFGGCGLVLSIIAGLFGINVDGIPGSDSTPYAFGLFAAILVILGIILIAAGLLYLGLKNPIREEQAEVRKLELDELVKMFQHEAETHAQVGKTLSRSNWTPTANDLLPGDTNYIIIQ